MSNDAIHTETRHDLVIKIYQDTDPQNPRTEWDNMGEMFCFHRRYNLGDKHDKSIEEVRELSERKDVISLPLFLYDHSGITMSTTAFSCPWDSGQVGVILVTYEKLRKEYSTKKITKAIKEKALGVLQREVKTYDDFLTGNVWGYVVETKEGEHLESCWGFFGDYDDKDFGALAKARETVDGLTDKGKTDEHGQMKLAI